MSSKKSEDDNQEITETIDLPDTLPVIVTGDLVAFPSVLMSLYIFDEKNKNAVKEAQEGSGVIMMLSINKDPGDSFDAKDLPKLGVAAQITKVFNMNDGRIKVLLQGLLRAKVKKVSKSEKFFSAKIEPIIPDIRKTTKKTRDLMLEIKEKLQILVELEQLPEEMLLVIEEIEDPGILADVIVAHYKLDVNYAQSLLEELDPLKRLKLTHKIISDDLSGFIVAENIKSKTHDELSRGQRDFFLREQIKQIKKELGEDEVVLDDLGELKKALEKAKLPAHAKIESDRQLKRLERMPVESSEYAMLRTYLEWMADLPWSKKTKEKFELKEAKKILDRDHYSLDKPKDRILEFLSVRKLKKESKGPILCFVGPPGVGKTSLGRSIADALNRNFIRLSLGGVRDEAEMRGHRRTYVGALPGRIIQGMKEAGSNNPVFMLDELDKVGADYRGDPASALLEVLDPQQNKDFRDHYLNVSFDLSKCLFIATANTLDTIPDALLDRLEVISIPGYTTDEKLNITKRYLVPRQIEENGLKKQKLKFDDKAIVHLIERYTREAGVRNLEREIGSICRKIARAVVAKEKFPKTINVKYVTEYLGPTKYDSEETENKNQVGLANGLAWTIHGGDIMPVEVSVANGKGQLNLTGRLGDVLQESAQAALFFARANSKSLGLDPEFHEKHDIHIHLPEGATPKDGPSAGITIVTALVSSLSNRKVRCNIAMTGEVTLRGNVLAIGGLKEKALAALRYGIKKVIIPASNVKDLEDIPKEQRDLIKFIPVKRVEEVLEVALEPEKKKVVKTGSKPKKVVKSRAKSL